MGLPVLYSFRRCPYAIRARLAIQVSNYQCQLREVLLRDKPVAMLTASPKATVPVLIISDDRIIDQSLDIMLHVLGISDPQGWLNVDRTTRNQIVELIEDTETRFKPHLDEYKYASRSMNPDPEYHRGKACEFLVELERRLCDNQFLFGEIMSLADAAILPFVRQFAQTDRQWFDRQAFPKLHPWLNTFESSQLRSIVMNKYAVWAPGDAETRFPKTV